MGGEVTNDVLAERIAQLRAAQHEDLAEIKLQLERLVSRELYEAHRSADSRQVIALETRVAALEARGRWLLACVLIPLLAIGVQIYLTTKHGGSP